MEAAAQANGTAGPVTQKIAAKTAGAARHWGRALGFRDRVLVDSRNVDKSLLIRGWHQMTAALGGAVGVGLAILFLSVGLANHRALVNAEVQERNADLRVALDLMSHQLESQQTALFDRAATERGLILIDSRDIDIKTLMAENERLLSTLNAALSLTEEPLPEDASEAALEDAGVAVSGDATASPGAAGAGTPLSADAQVLARELALVQTQKDLLEAELDIERQTLDTMASELAATRQETRALEREAQRLGVSLEARDEVIAGLKRDIISFQTGKTDTDEARRRAMQLLNEQNAELAADLTATQAIVADRDLQLKSLEGQLAQREADNTRLTSLVKQREAQIASLTDAQSLILDRLESRVEEQMAAVQKAIDMTGVTQDTTLNLDALLDSVSSPFWNGMGGQADEGEIERREFAVTADPSTAGINALLDRALMIERLTEELEHRRNHFDALPTHRPVEGLRVSSGYGMRKHPISGKYRMHKGMDFAGPSGTRVSAAGPGRVVYASRKGSYGNLVEIDHGNGVISRYAHLRKISVKKGAAVVVGQKVGEVGSTGASTGPHLHWEVLVLDQAKDPKIFLGARKSL